MFGVNYLFDAGACAFPAAFRSSPSPASRKDAVRAGVGRVGPGTFAAVLLRLPSRSLTTVHDARGLQRREFEQFVGEFVGFFAFRARTGDGDGEAAQVFHEREAQSDRDGPQFADRERRDGLIGGDESAQRVCVETRVGVRDQRERDCVDPRIAFQFTFGEFWQFVVVAFR